MWDLTAVIQALKIGIPSTESCSRLSLSKKISATCAGGNEKKDPSSYFVFNEVGIKSA